LVLLSLGLAGGASALDPRLSITHYIHTSWTQNEGAPLPEVRAVVQAADGYLWLGTNKGLLRFDGLRFVRWEALAGLPTDDIHSLAASKTGGLWIETNESLWKLEPGRATSSIVPGILSSAHIVTLLEDRAGRLWAGGLLAKVGGLALLEKDVTRVFRVEDGLPSPEVDSLFVDRDDTLWVGTAEGFCKWTGDACVEGVPPHKREVAATPTQKAIKMVTSIVRDKDGNLWVGTFADGLYCVGNGRLEHFTSQNGLSSDAVNALMEDREGNIWVGTHQGLDRFREPTVARWSTLQGLAGNMISAVCATRTGDVWMASFGKGLNCMRGNRLLPQKVDPSTARTISLFEDANGTLWAGTSGGGVFRQSEGRFVRVPADGKPFNMVFAMAEDRRKTLWLADSFRGLATIQDGRIVPANLPGIAQENITQFASDPKGDLWIGYHGGGVAHAKEGSAELFGPESGLAGGAVHAIAADGRGDLWFGTAEGLSRYRRGAWTTWTVRLGIPQGGVQAIIDDRSGHLWLITGAGLSQVSLVELDKTPDGKPGQLHLPVYGQNDGVRMVQGGPTSNPRITRSTDGRLWSSTTDGVASVDPASIRTNLVPPPVAIEQVTVDGQPLSPEAAKTGFRGRQLQFEYTALSLSLPESVRFRYKLEGLNSDWIEAQTQRKITYADLRPSHYRFVVTACNNDGIWNITGASFAFQIAPHFYQTWWFALLCVGTSVGGAHSLHRLRIRRLRSRFQLVLQERARLTRELHDTVLQGFAGVVYQLEAASRQITTSPDASKRRIDRALEQADQSLREAREALSCLRLSALEDKSLAEAVKMSGGQILDGTGIHFEMNVRGKARELPYDAQATVFIVAREAMNNALNHAQPVRVRVDLDYTPQALRLVVQDDGKGFDVEHCPQKVDHWGLSGMRERAHQIHADLTIESTPGRGTKVELVVNGRALRRPKE
jgi:signal transduction histidine kinase/ligand-binding sensor domain-containing protein